jgi:ribonuclease HI
MSNSHKFHASIDGSVSPKSIRKMKKTWVSTHYEYYAGFDGSAKPNPGQMRIGGWICGPNGQAIKKFSNDIGLGTNNEAEYRALITLLKIVDKMEVKSIKIVGDSQVVINQVNKKAKARDKRMREFRDEVLSLLKGKYWSLKFIPRKFNADADSLT